jgi:hypothetical protein
MSYIIEYIKAKFGQDAFIEGNFLDLGSVIFN